jgi:hypothetical protein
MAVMGRKIVSWRTVVWVSSLLGWVATGCVSSSALPLGGGDAETTPASGSTTTGGAASSTSQTSSTRSETDGDGGAGDAATISSSEGGAGDAATISSSEGGACTKLALSDGFETDTPGMPPNPALWHPYMGCNQANMADGPAPDGGLFIEVDNAQHFSGNNSLRVVEGDSCGYYAINTSAFSQLGEQVYARFYGRFSGNMETPDSGMATQNHNGFLSMYSGSTLGSDSNFFNVYNTSTATSGQLRLGSQSDVLDWNNIITWHDATLPDLDPMGEMGSVNPAANQWNCFEFHIDQSTGHIEFWFNDASVTGLSWDGSNVSGVNDQWYSMGPPTPLMLQSFGLGWLNLSVTETAWYDDVALASCRIGCE